MSVNKIDKDPCPPGVYIAAGVKINDKCHSFIFCYKVVTATVGRKGRLEKGRR